MKAVIEMKAVIQSGGRGTPQTLHHDSTEAADACRFQTGSGASSKMAPAEQHSRCVHHHGISR